MNPDVIYVAIPPFGEHGAMAELAADEWAVAAFGGVMAGQRSKILLPASDGVIN